MRVTIEKSRLIERFPRTGRHRWKTAGFFLVLLLCLSFTPGGLRDSSLAEESRAVLVSSIQREIRTGDLIFRRGRGLESDIADSLDAAGHYSHVGMAFVDDENVFVIHAVPDDGVNRKGVITELLGEFLSFRDAMSFGIYRTSIGSEPLVEIVTYALSLVGRPFDSVYDLSNQDKLYCTELVWIAFHHSRVELIDRFDRFEVPLLGSGSYITIDRLRNGRGIYKVFQSGV